MGGGDSAGLCAPDDGHQSEHDGQGYQFRYRRASQYRASHSHRPLRPLRAPHPTVPDPETCQDCARLGESAYGYNMWGLRVCHPLSTCAPKSCKTRLMPQRAIAASEKCRSSSFHFKISLHGIDASTWCMSVPYRDGCRRGFRSLPAPGWLVSPGLPPEPRARMACCHASTSKCR